MTLKERLNLKFNDSIEFCKKTINDEGEEDIIWLEIYNNSFMLLATLYVEFLQYHSFDDYVKKYIENPEYFGEEALEKSIERGIDPYKDILLFDFYVQKYPKIRVKKLSKFYEREEYNLNDEEKEEIDKYLSISKDLSEEKYNIFHCAKILISNYSPNFSLDESPIQTFARMIESNLISNDLIKIKKSL